MRKDDSRDRKFRFLFDKWQQLAVSQQLLQSSACTRPRACSGSTQTQNPKICATDGHWLPCGRPTTRPPEIDAPGPRPARAPACAPARCTWVSPGLRRPWFRPATRRCPGRRPAKKLLPRPRPGLAGLRSRPVHVRPRPASSGVVESIPWREPGLAPAKLRSFLQSPGRAPGPRPAIWPRPPSGTGPVSARSLPGLRQSLSGLVRPGPAATRPAPRPGPAIPG